MEQTGIRKLMSISIESTFDKAGLAIVIKLLSEVAVMVLALLYTIAYTGIRAYKQKNQILPLSS